MAPAVVHWSSDGWRTIHDTPTRDTGLGVHLADLPTEKLAAGGDVVFTFHWPEAGRWEGQGLSRDGDGGRGAASRRAAPAPSNGKKQSEPGKKAKGKKKQRR